MIRSSQASVINWPAFALFIFKVIIFCFIFSFFNSLAKLLATTRLSLPAPIFHAFFT